MRLLWLACTFCRSFFTIFWFPFPLWLALLRGWTLLDGGLCLSSAHPFFLLPSPAIPLYDSCCEVVCLNPAGPLWTCLLFFSQWLNKTISSFITSLAGSCVPFVFSWASLAPFFSLGFLGPFLNSAFSWAFTEFFGLPRPNCIIPHPWGSWACHYPLLSLFSLLWACHSPFSHFHITYRPWVSFFSLFRLL